ncbi:hypothetical protein EW146_g4154 [Bondarzewia mesenterica]|uniref:Phytocyanin domain-containing protein n=1 Tax=Bondarzewia mesenterica TaxID=1095465 RepID=A0A4S4LVC6_9AGAM|nr:hypothetical protein EW146_g4154 [Bondarzewia mesenterica]
MRFSLAAAVLPVLAASVSAQNTIQVHVGANNGLTYEPSSVNASVGDTIQFLFMAKNHTVTQSAFASPCANLSTGGIDSGFQAVSANSTLTPSYSFVLNDTTPLWFYCRQTGHCAKGMVFAVNPTAAKTFTAFQAAANASGSTTASSASASGTAPASASGSAARSASAPSASASGTSSGTSSGAMTHGVRAGAVLAALGFAAGMIL